MINSWQLMIRLEMKNYNMILIEKLLKYQLYHLTQTGKYEYLTGEEILPYNQKQIIKQAKFTCSPLKKLLQNK